MDRTEAENALTVIRSALREFELDINPGKTRIVPVEELREPRWVQELNAFEIAEENHLRQKQNLHRYFSYALEVARDDEEALKYAVRKSSSFLVHPENWSIYEAYLIKSATTVPNCISAVVQILITDSESLGYRVGKEPVTRFCASTISQGAPQEHHSEVAWALWLAIELGLQLPPAVSRILSKMRNSVCALLALHARSCGLVERKFDTSVWQKLVTLDSATNGHWLLAYEASRNGWLDGKGKMSSDPYFQEMFKLDVGFYDPEIHTQPLIRRKPSADEFSVDLSDFEFDDTAAEYIA